MKIHRKRYKENILKYTKSIFHGEYKELDHKDSLVINRYIRIYIHTYIYIYIYIYIYCWKICRLEILTNCVADY